MGKSSLLYFIKATRTVIIYVEEGIIALSLQSHWITHHESTKSKDEPQPIFRAVQFSIGQPILSKKRNNVASDVTYLSICKL